MVNARIRKLAGFGVIFALLVVSVGAYTRLADAGLGCPDWPGCYGFLTVPDEATEISTAEARYPEAPVEFAKAWWEMGHRYIAGALLLLVASILFMAYRAREEEDTPLKLAAVLMFVILWQAAFGAWTVTLKLWPQVVTGHLIGGFTTLSLMWLLFLRQGGLSDMVSALPRPNWLAKIAFVAVVVQIILGGWVSSNYAALACYDFPSCDGTYTPNIDLQQGFNIFQSVGPNYLGGLMTNEARMAIHWVHRIGAIVVLLVVGGLVIQTVKQAAVIGYVLLAVLVTQITLGILNVVWVLPLLNATAHNTVGALLLLVLVTINFAPRLRIVQS
ncbi:MAG: heme A synthase [Gammaproteobacteria bacterium TMED243]|nr:cytochrome B [Gammaproteobacteria bacterium]RPG31300.1 MAG: heme A synthase [Gammaproteobacteria bacterium TMED243]